MSAPAISVEQVVAFLTEVGYRQLNLPLTVASIPFDFSAALVGTERASDLIIVLDTVDEREEFAMKRKIEGFSRALDVAGSRRPLTAVLVGPRPRPKTLEAIGRVSRLLFVGSKPETDDLSLRDNLAILLPLRLPLPEEITVDPIDALTAAVPPNTDTTVLSAVISATAESAVGVQHTLRSLLEEPFKYEGETGNNL
jgi:hypothetical protein